MSTSAPSKYSKTLSTLAAALSLVSLSAMAQERESSPMGYYVGSTFGVGVTKWDCGTSCNRSTFSGKLFGGRRFTPSMAMEINYMWFGGTDRANDAGQTAATGIAAERRKTRVATFGVMKEIPILENFATQMRVGIANVKEDRTITYAGASTTTRKFEHTNAPYIGLGTTIEAMPNFNLVSAFDWVLNGRNTNFLFSIGGSYEF